MKMNRLCTAGGAVVLLTMTTAFAAERRIEVSADGRQTVVLDGPELPGVGFKARGSTVPFGATPDWTYNVRRQVGGIRVRDMNSDGLPDVICSLYHSNSFPAYEDWHNLIFYNTGTEPEANPSWISTDQVSSGDLDVGNINNDAYPDFFAANGATYPPSVIYFGSPTGPSTSPGWSSAVPGGTWTNYVKLFDFDHDGDLDAFTANQGASEFDPYRPIYMFRNNNGTLETVPSWSSAEVSIQGFLDFGDLDGDGWEDLAVSKWANFESGVYKNVMGVMATTPLWTTGLDGTDRGVLWGDYDGDDDQDLIIGEQPSRLYTNTSGALAPTQAMTPPFAGTQDMIKADLDGDGDLDYAEIHFGDGRTHIYINNDGVFDATPSWTYDSTSVGNTVAAGDIDGNGRNDLVIGYSGNTSIVIFFAEDFPPCPADIAGNDGVVNVNDLFQLLANWNTNGAGADLAPPTNIVDVNDLFVLLSVWGDC